MGSRGIEVDGQPTADSTPEDVAALYSWANLQGAKYRDYSASRREHRAQARYRAAKSLLERELKAQEEAEASAAEAERIALAAEASANAESPHDTPTTRLHSVHRAEAAARKAAADRVEAARRAEAAAHAAVQALREQREISEAHSSAQHKALAYREAEQRRRQLAGPQPHFPSEPGLGDAETPRTTFEDTRLFPDSPIQPSASAWPASPEFLPANGDTHPTIEYDPGPAGPAWLYASATPPQARVLQSISQTHPVELPHGDTLLDFRERVASRWFALKDVFDRPSLQLAAMQPQRPGIARTQVLAAFSLAGGVGKTSLVATLGRALSSQGEKIVLTDITAHGLLPIYFGMHQIRPGTVCTLPPLPGETAPPLSLVSYDIAATPELQRQQETFANEVLRNAQDHQRLVLDLPSGSTWLLRRIADLRPTVLVPMAPDMNSVISLMAVERLFRGITDSDGLPILPVYVLNQFDATLPLHLDVREVLRRQLGDRLLRTAIRRSPAVSEALAEGMTVLEYAPDAPVVQDYLDVASWLRSVSTPAKGEVRSVLRGES